MATSTEPGVTGRRVLVTGAGGFIGSHMVRALLTAGADVYAMSSSVSSVMPPRLADIGSDLRLVEANITDRSAMEAMARTVQPELVAHLAAFTHVGKSFRRVDENIATNIQGTVNLLQALDGRYERFVYTGTSEIYGDTPAPFREDGPVNPVSPYSVSKYAGERYALMFHQAYGWPIVCLRPFNAYGPWQTPDRVIPEIILTALRRGELLMTDGRQTREFNYVEDLAAGFVAALGAPGNEGSVINLGCGQEVSIRHLTTLVLELMGNPIQAQFGALAHRPTEIWSMFCDNTRARERLDWAPAHDLGSGLARTIEWYRSEWEAGNALLRPGRV
ncbi:MAG TPA: SDR family NAD(P)-dependent oxidoreductase [Acidimicrobiales bacterium]|nr:SDR family NAD(P)-dependent oxidoreductase [Acidimicrobiales bacterium]